MHFIYFHLTSILTHTHCACFWVFCPSSQHWQASLPASRLEISGSVKLSCRTISCTCHLQAKISTPFWPCSTMFTVYLSARPNLGCETISHFLVTTYDNLWPLWPLQESGQFPRCTSSLSLSSSIWTRLPKHVCKICAICVQKICNMYGWNLIKCH